MTSDVFTKTAENIKEQAKNKVEDKDEKGSQNNTENIKEKTKKIVEEDKEELEIKQVEENGEKCDRNEVTDL